MKTQRDRARSAARFIALWIILICFFGWNAATHAANPDSARWITVFYTAGMCMYTALIVYYVGVFVNAILAHREECAKEASRRGYTTA